MVQYFALHSRTILILAWPTDHLFMNAKPKALLAALFVFFAVAAQSATYSGNGNSGFGGPIGLGSLTLTDNGTTVSGTVNKGPNGFNDVLVLYIDSTAGGFNDTSGFGDGADGLRRAMSGFDGGGDRKLVRFTAGVPAGFGIR